MIETEIEKRRGDSRSWTKFEKYWDTIPTNCTTLVVETKLAKSLEPLRRLKDLRSLYISGVRPQDVALLGELGKLTTLLLWSVRTTSVDELHSLRSLEALKIQHAAKLTTLEGLESLKSLRFLSMYHIPRVSDLGPLASLTNLVELTIEMSWGTNNKLEFTSLKPLQKLRNLRLLELRGVAPLDDSLNPICSLKQLRHLFPCSYTLPIEEYARLSACLHLDPSDQLRPIKELNNPSFTCKKCKAQLVMYVGRLEKRYKQLGCPNCDQSEITERTKIFDSYASKHL